MTVSPLRKGHALEIDKVSKAYGHFLAVDDVSLAVEPGEIVAILGPSGSGKTALLGMVGGRIAADGGDIRIGGNSVMGLPPEKIDAATVFQDYALFPHLSVLENVGFGLRVRGVAKAEARKRALEMLAIVGLEALADRNIAQLSGGQRQRVATARALAVHPGILLLDEPLGALDRQIRGRLQEELARLLRRLNVTALLVTHDQEEAFTMADRIAVMQGGKLEQYGPPAELYRWPATEFVATFLGNGTIVEGRRAGGTDDLPLFEVAGAFVVARSRVAVGASARLLVRPEHVEVGPAGSQPAPTWRDARLAGVVNTGGTSRLTLEIAGTTLEALSLGGFDLVPGQTVDCTLAAEAAVVL
ncbi:ABC transporter ATP-binding protein [Zavarzinia aquatilis]|uniref:Spermidine/putrescine ABC transporter ATP-binding protein n=1 Tax=Zavarzinia aquatilis TaxID=2211142 RepID=A0A317EF24_9PROT|nr:ABC transporter ATP-binding protein [Zavarzinia aquatilis]PWR25212.1 spermidine/putrescine ABC transporter ATP-binding protein [Zavarzinia aquatilis]